jgi:hypothetical protein
MHMQTYPKLTQALPYQLNARLDAGFTAEASTWSIETWQHSVAVLHVAVGDLKPHSSSWMSKPSQKAHKAMLESISAPHCVLFFRYNRAFHHGQASANPTVPPAELNQATPQYTSTTSRQACIVNRRRLLPVEYVYFHSAFPGTSGNLNCLPVFGSIHEDLSLSLAFDKSYLPHSHGHPLSNRTLWRRRISYGISMIISSFGSFETFHYAGGADRRSITVFPFGPFKHGSGWLR